MAKYCNSGGCPVSTEGLLPPENCLNRGMKLVYSNFNTSASAMPVFFWSRLNSRICSDCRWSLERYKEKYRKQFLSYNPFELASSHNASLLVFQKDEKACMHIQPSFRLSFSLGGGEGDNIFERPVDQKQQYLLRKTESNHTRPEKDQKTSEEKNYLYFSIEVLFWQLMRNSKNHLNYTCKQT